jgi:hypothetical protein
LFTLQRFPVSGSDLAVKINPIPLLSSAKSEKMSSIQA